MVSHLRLHAGLADFLQPDGVDARILVSVFDLRAAFLQADIAAAPFRANAAFQYDWITLAAEAERQIARGFLARIEMLVEHLVRWREHHAVLPFHALVIALPVIPKQAIAAAMDEQHMQAGAVAVALFIGADRHFGDMR